MKEKLYFYKFIDVKVIFINIYNSRKAGKETTWQLAEPNSQSKSAAKLSSEH